MLNEGLIKVHPKLLEFAVNEFRSIIISRAYNFFRNDIGDDYNDPDYRELYDADFSYFEKKKDYINPKIKIDHTDLELSFVVDIPKEFLTIERYPEPEKDIKCGFMVLFNNEQISGSYVEPSQSEDYDCAIILYTTQHIKRLGVAPSGKTVFTVDYSRLERDFDSVKGVIGHELMHLMQHKVIKSHDIENADYENPEDDYDVYFNSDVEFSPTIYSEVEKFIDKAKKRNIISDKDKLMSLFKMVVSYNYDMVNTSAFFHSLKRKNPTKYKKAVKLFYSQILEVIKKEA